MASDDDLASSFISLGGSSLDTPLMDLLMCKGMVPGAEPSYQMCKIIYLNHPLGAKMADAPISMAQSQEREIAVQEAPEEVAQAFKDEWDDLGADSVIHNFMSLSRVYGIASLVILVDGQGANTPLDPKTLAGKDVWFNVLDPLNTSGSLVLNQVPTAKDFNKPMGVSVNGERYHRSRFQVMMNENPIYISYTPSAFGFVGRSVYQRALFLLKSFIRTMIADDMIATKLGVIIAKQKGPGSVITRGMQAIAGIKRDYIKMAHTNNVITIDVEEEVSTLDMTNVEPAGTMSRTNIIKNAATAADMPAKMLENETLIGGMAEGTEDAKAIAFYVDSIRKKMQPPYKWFNNIAQYRAWTPAFHERMRAKYGDEVPIVYEDAFTQWRENFSATWPSLLIEPESDQIEVEKVKLEGIISVLSTMLPVMDPENMTLLIQAALDNISENKRMFAHEFTIDPEELLAHLEQQVQQQKDAQAAETEATSTTAEASMKKASAPPAKGLPKLKGV